MMWARNEDKVSLLHVEPTSRCNAMCPACPRNNNGYKVKESLVLQDLDPNVIINAAKQFYNLSCLHLCGNVGDPIAYKHINELLDSVIAFNERCHELFLMGYGQERHWTVNIATNGSLRSVDWWQELGKKCHEQIYKLHKVVFGIDGLADTNYLYRQATDFNKIMDNAKAFIDNGGIAEWQFLVFKHNEHQIEEARKLSMDMGFDRFFILRPGIMPDGPFNWKTGKKYKLEVANMWNDQSVETSNYERNIKNNAEAQLLQSQMLSSEELKKVPLATDNILVKHKNCMHINVNNDDSNEYSYYLRVSGKLFPCCYFPNDYNYDHEEKFNIKTLDIENEFNTNNYRLMCLKMCGSIK